MARSRPRLDGQLARRLRIKRGYTVAQIAELTGKSIKAIYSYEARNVCPRPNVRRQLEELYGLPEGTLLVEQEAA